MATQRRTRQRRVKKKPCSFCLERKIPDFLEVEVLKKFTSERGKILGREKTGVCAKHQRRLTVAVKRARHLALLPFVGRG